MGLRLPAITTKIEGADPKWGDSVGVQPNADARLKALLDLESPVGLRPNGDRCVPLGNTHWCIGRTRNDGCVWRILPRQALAQVHHPAWLWIEDGWFDVLLRTRGPRPEMHTLASQLHQAKALQSRPNQNNRILATAVSILRKGKTPLAIVFDEEQTTLPGQPLRWFALALLTCLPPKMRASLRISTAEISPDPKHWDVVFTTRPIEGFNCLAHSSAKTHGKDPVADFIVNALSNHHSERVEALAFMNFGDGPDPWGAAALRLQDDEHWSTRDITPDVVRNQPEKALGHMLFLYAWGKPVHVPFARRLTAYTIRTGDPTPWQPLMARHPDERALAVEHYLQQTKKPRPTPPLLYSIAMARPKGTIVDLWCRSLLEWAEHPPLAEVTEELILETLSRDSMPEEPTSRSSLWTLLLQRMLDACRYSDARRLFRHSATHRLLQCDVSRVVAMGWLRLPKAHQDAVELSHLIERMDGSRDGDRAVTILADALFRSDQEELTTVVIQQWARLQARQPLRENDAALQWVQGTPFARDWVGEVARFAPQQQVAAWIQPLTKGPRDSLWTFAEASRARALELDTRERLVASLIFCPHGGHAIEQAMRRMLTSLTFEGLPDADIAQAAMTFGHQTNSSAVWRLLGCVAAPESHPDQEREAMMNLSEQPPQTNAEQMVCKSLARALGFQHQRTAAQHAQWLRAALDARIAHPSEFTLALAQWLATGLSQRDPEGLHFAEVTNILGQDADDSPIVELFLRQVIPAVWPNGAPSGYVQGVQQEHMSDHVLGLWRSTVFSSSRPPPRR